MVIYSNQKPGWLRPQRDEFPMCIIRRMRLAGFAEMRILILSMDGGLVYLYQ